MSKDQLKEERLKVLELLAKGVITSDEAEKLLSAMDKTQEKFVEQMVIPTKKLPFRMLRMYIDSKDGDVVKIQIPIEFAKLLKTQKFNVNLKDNDIDIDAILEMVNQGFVGEIVNIESADGDIVKIVVE
jgi:ribosomal protein S17